jgi:hypothetical protein
MPAGRPPALDESKRREICALLCAGFNLEEAARYVSCSSRTIQREVQRNSSFRESANAAMRSARLKPEMLLRQAAGRSWQAAAWLLQRTNPRALARCQAAVCTTGDFEAVCRWLTDAAMRQVPSDRRTAMYDKLTTISRTAVHQLLVRSGPRKSLRTPPTILFDQAQIDGQTGMPGSPPTTLDATTFAVDITPSRDVASHADCGPANAASAPPTSGQNSGVVSVPTHFPAHDTIAEQPRLGERRGVA